MRPTKAELWEELLKEKEENKKLLETIAQMKWEAGFFGGYEAGQKSVTEIEIDDLFEEVDA